MIGRSLWYIVTPIYWPAPGGAAMYTKLLAEALAKDGADVVVATEGFPGTGRLERQGFGKGSVVLDRLFPLRAGRAVVDWRSYVAYARLNLLMLSLPRRLARAVRETKAERVVVLVHSSFFYKWSLMPSVLERMRRQLPDASRLVIDVRDPLFDHSLTALFARFDAAVGCSRMISDRLRALLPDSVEVAHIPIPFEAGTPPDETAVAKILVEHGLDGVPYVLNPNGILDAKRYPEMLDAIRELRRMPGHEDTVLVTIGRCRDWKARDDAAVAEGVLKYVGIVTNRNALALAKGAKAMLILSPIEGMPRSALEMLALGKPIVAPPIPEFVEHIPTSVAGSSLAVDVAHQLIRVSEQPATERYPLELHRMATLTAAYRRLEPAFAAKPGRLTE
jgi:glycosyltransferase involved in cell wall biosynthesis